MRQLEEATLPPVREPCYNPVCSYPRQPRARVVALVKAVCKTT